MNKYTSLELSKKLAENGFKKNSRYRYAEKVERIKGKAKYSFVMTARDYGQCYFEEAGCGFNTYDILNDLCAKYAKEVFGDDEEIVNDKICTIMIMKKSKVHTSKEAEEYLWEHCKFNPKNK